MKKLWTEFEACKTNVELCHDLTAQLTSLLEVIWLGRVGLDQLDKEQACKRLRLLLEHFGEHEALGPSLVASYTLILQPNVLTDSEGTDTFAPTKIHASLAQATLVSIEDTNSADIDALTLELLRCLGEARTMLQEATWLKTSRDEEWELTSRFVEDAKMLWADALLLRHVSGACAAQLTSLKERDNLRQRCLELQSKRRLGLRARTLSSYHDWWIPSEPGDLPQGLLEMGKLVWECVGHRHRSRRQAFEDATNQLPLPLELAGERFRHIPRVAGALSWTFGTGGTVVQVEDDRYAQAPMMAQYMTRAIVLGEEQSQAHRIALRLNRPLESRRTVPIGDGDRTQFVLTPTEAKTFLYLTTHAVSSAVIVKQTLGELVRVLYPGHNAHNLSRT